MTITDMIAKFEELFGADYRNGLDLNVACIVVSPPTLDALMWEYATRVDIENVDYGLHLSIWQQMPSTIYGIPLVPSPGVQASEFWVVNRRLSVTRLSFLPPPIADMFRDYVIWNYTGPLAMQDTLVSAP